MLDTIFSPERLQEAMNGMSNIELAEKLGCARSNISMYLSGKRTPTKMTIQLMAICLGVSPTWLMGLNVPKYIDRPTLNSESGPSDEAMKVARAYDQADPKDQRTVRVILDIEDEYNIGLVARGGKTVTPTRTARKSVIDQLTRESEAEADKENERL